MRTSTLRVVICNGRYIVSYVDDFIHIEYTLWGAKTFFFVLMEYCSSGNRIMRADDYW